MLHKEKMCSYDFILIIAFVLLPVQTNNISLVEPAVLKLVSYLSMKPSLNQESSKNEFTCLFVSRIIPEKNLGLPVSV